MPYLTCSLGKDKDGFPIDLLGIFWGHSWLFVLAAPNLYRALDRPIDKPFLLELLDIWVAYADRGEYYLVDEVPDPDRAALAHKLRALVEAWTPPELPPEITEVARELLRAEGYKEVPKGARTWDEYTFDPDRPLADQILWRENLCGASLIAKVATPR